MTANHQPMPSKQSEQLVSPPRKRLKGGGRLSSSSAEVKRGESRTDLGDGVNYLRNESFKEKKKFRGPAYNGNAPRE